MLRCAGPNGANRLYNNASQRGTHCPGLLVHCLKATGLIEAELDTCERACTGLPNSESLFVPKAAICSLEVDCGRMVVCGVAYCALETRQRCTLCYGCATIEKIIDANHLVVSISWITH